MPSLEDQDLESLGETVSSVDLEESESSSEEEVISSVSSASLADEFLFPLLDSLCEDSDPCDCQLVAED